MDAGTGYHQRRRDIPAVPAWSARAPDTCVKVDVFRNQRAGGNPLPMFFSRLVGITNQGVRATATAQIITGDTTDCLKPWADSRQWLDELATTHRTTSGRRTTYSSRYVRTVINWVQLARPGGRLYTRPGAVGRTGFTVEDDYGTQIGAQSTAIRSRRSRQVGSCQSSSTATRDRAANNYRDNIASCGAAVGHRARHRARKRRPGDMVGPTGQGVAELIARDSAARLEHQRPTKDSLAVMVAAWRRSRAASAPGLVAHRDRSTRIIDDSCRASGRTDIVDDEDFGFCIERMQWQVGHRLL